MKRLRNTSGIPDETVRGIVNWIAETLGISAFDVECRNAHGHGPIAGHAFLYGSGYHSSPRPFVVLRVGTDEYRWQAWENGGRKRVRHNRRRFPCFVAPYQYRHHKGKRYVLANRIEALVYLAAHELRHLWQAARLTDKRKSAMLPMAPGSRGKFSEVDTEAFAIHSLREWRRIGISENEKQGA